MGHAVAVTTATRTVSVDGRDAAAWAGRAWDESAPDLAVTAADYVDANPRAGSAGIAAAQRVAILRRLAAGPATRSELLAAMRAAGWVGADDFENRWRDLRAGDKRAASPLAGVPLASDGTHYWLTEPFPLLDEADRRALGFAKMMTERLDSPLARQAGDALEGLLPGLSPAPHQRVSRSVRQTMQALEAFDAARSARRPVRVRYFSLNQGREGSYVVVPVEYVTVGATVKAVCVRFDDEGRRDRDLQFALERLISVSELDDHPPLPPEDVQPRRSPVKLRVTDGLYQVMRTRNLLGIGEADVDAEQSDYEDQTWLVSGTFPVALAWDVMEQVCAWAGTAQVLEPLWLVNAVMRRLRAGMRVMEQGGDFELVKPEPERVFASHKEALTEETPADRPTGPRILKPRANRQM